MYKNRKRVLDAAVQFRCTRVEEKYIQVCAKENGKTVSEYLRRQATQGFLHKDKSLPPEVLAFQGQLAHTCGLLEVIARKRLDGDELNALERAQVNELREQLTTFLEKIKTHLR